MSHATRTLKTLLWASATLAAALAAGRAANAADHPNLQPGNWETSFTMEMAGMPPRPAITSTHCIKADQVRDSKSFAEHMQEHNKGKCQVSDLKLDSDKLSYSFACENGASGTTELAFGGTTYEGTTKMSIPGHGGAPMTMTQRFKSKRIGDC